MRSKSWKLKLTMPNQTIQETSVKDKTTRFLKIKLSYTVQFTQLEPLIKSSLQIKIATNLMQEK